MANELTLKPLWRSAEGNGRHTLINLLQGSVNVTLNVSIWKTSLPGDMNSRSGWTDSMSVWSKGEVRVNLCWWAWCRSVAVSSQSSRKVSMNSTMHGLASLMSAWWQTQAWLASWTTSVWSWDVLRKYLLGGIMAWRVWKWLKTEHI